MTPRPAKTGPPGRPDPGRPGPGGAAGLVGLQRAAFVAALAAVAYRLMFSGMSEGFRANCVADYIAFIAAALYLAGMTRRGDRGDRGARPLSINLAGAAFALFVIVYYIACRFSPYPRGGALEIMDAVALGAIFIVVSGGLFAQRDAPKAAAYLAAVAVIPVAAAIYQYAWEFPRMMEELLRNPPPGVYGGIYIDAKSAADFITRVESREVFGTLFTSNVLAAFLALALPATLGLAVAILTGARASRRRRFAAAAALGALCVSEAVVVVLTKSKAGMIAAALGVAVFAAIALYRAVSRKTFIAVVAACVLLAGIGVLGITRSAGGRQAMYEASTSLSVRTGYWGATWRMIKDNPAMGVGPGNFAERYVNYKEINDREVRNPHNAYLLVWASGGIFALLFFVAFWVLVFTGPIDGAGGTTGATGEARGAPRPDKTGRGTHEMLGEAGGGGGARDSGLLAAAAPVLAAAIFPFAQLAAQGRLWAGGVEGAAFADGLARTIVELYYAAANAGPVMAGALVATALIMLVWPVAAGARWRWARSGLVGGVAAFAVAIAVDVTWSDMAAATAAVFASAALSPRRRVATLRDGWKAALAAGAAVVALVTFAGFGAIPMFEAEGDVEAARASLYAGDASRAAARLDRAMGLDPTGSEAPGLVGSLYESLAMSPGAGPKKSDYLKVAEEYYDRALQRNPYYFPAHAGLARIYAAAGPATYAQAFEEYGELFSLYPYNSQYHVAAAALYEKAGRAGEALGHYRLALEIDAATKEHGAQLSPEERARAASAIARLERLKAGQ